MTGAGVAARLAPVPYWWEAAPRPDPASGAPPDETDVAVIGSGFTGLHAALGLARGGRTVLVIEAEALGHGASTRNNGAVIPYLYAKHDVLERRYGAERAAALARGGVDAVGFFLDFVREEQIECALAENDRFFVALVPAHYERLARTVDLYRRSGVDTGWESMSAPALESEIGLGGHHGGVCARGSLTIHPGLYHAGLLDRAGSAGVAFADRTRVTRVARRAGGGFDVHTARGPVRAREVVIATNGYTGAATPWMRRRVMPIRLYMAVTEPLPDALRARVFPKRRVIVDSKTNITWVRVTPDGTRVMTGGRAGMGGEDARAHAAVLHRDMARLVPALAPLRIEHCWYGWMGFPFDNLPHIGCEDGVHYALGYCGAGVAMASWFGHKLARRILGAPHADTPFDARAFPTRPLYRGQAWPVSLAIRWIDARDAWETRRAGARRGLG